MQKKIKYGFYVEDEAQVIFLERVLPQILIYLKLTDQFEFEKDEAYTSIINLFPLDNGGRRRFDLTFKNNCEIGIVNYEQDVFILGRDLDKSTLFDLEKQIKNILGQIDEKLRSKVIIFLPARCTEHWLRYIKEINKTEGQDLTQKFEQQRNETVKHNLYKNKKRKERKAYIQELCSDIDIDSLCQLSESFNHFVESIQSFLHKLEQE